MLLQFQVLLQYIVGLQFLSKKVGAVGTICLAHQIAACLDFLLEKGCVISEITYSWISYFPVESQHSSCITRAVKYVRYEELFSRPVHEGTMRCLLYLVISSHADGFVHSSIFWEQIRRIKYS